MNEMYLIMIIYKNNLYMDDNKLKGSNNSKKLNIG